MLRAQHPGGLREQASPVSSERGRGAATIDGGVRQVEKAFKKAVPTK
jgi:hypothetical protein